MPPKQANNNNEPRFICRNPDCGEREFMREYLLRFHLWRAREYEFTARVQDHKTGSCKHPHPDDVQQHYRFPYSVNACGEAGCHHIAPTSTHLKAHRNIHDFGKMHDEKWKKFLNIAPFLHPCQTAPVADGEDPCFVGDERFIEVHAHQALGANGFRALISRLEEQVDEHMEECHPELPGDLECTNPACNATFHTQTSFLAHCDEAHNKTVFKCPFPSCNKKWSTDDLKDDPERLVSSVFTHVRVAHVMAKCPHCDFEVKCDCDLSRNMKRRHFTFKNLVEDEEFSNEHGLTGEDRQRCIDDPGDFPAFVVQLVAESVIASNTRAFVLVQKLANLCDPIRIYRDYKDGYKSVKCLFEAIDNSASRKSWTRVYKTSDGTIIEPNKNNRRPVLPRLDVGGAAVLIEDENLHEDETSQSATTTATDSSSSSSSSFDDSEFDVSRESFTSKDSSSSSTSSTVENSHSDRSLNENIKNNNNNVKTYSDDPSWIHLGTNEFRACFARAELRRREAAQNKVKLAHERKKKNNSKAHDENDGNEYGSSASDNEADGVGDEKQELYKEFKALDFLKQWNSNNNINNGKTKKIDDWSFSGMNNGKNFNCDDDYVGADENEADKDVSVCPRYDSLGKSNYLTESEIDFFLSDTENSELRETTKKLVDSQRELAQLKNFNRNNVKSRDNYERISVLEALVHRCLCYLLRFKQTLREAREKEVFDTFVQNNNNNNNDSINESNTNKSSGTALKPILPQLCYSNNNNNNNNHQQQQQDAAAVSTTPFSSPHPSTLLLHPHATGITLAAESFRARFFIHTPPQSLARSSLMNHPRISSAEEGGKKPEDGSPSSAFSVMRVQGRIYDFNDSPFQHLPPESLLDVVLRSAALFDPSQEKQQKQKQSGENDDDTFNLDLDCCRYCHIPHNRPLLGLKMLAGVSNYERVRRTNEIATLRGEEVSCEMHKRELCMKHEGKSIETLFRLKAFTDRQIDSNLNTRSIFERNRNRFIDRIFSKVEKPRRVRCQIEQTQIAVCLEEVTRDSQEIQNFLRETLENNNHSSILYYKKVQNSSTGEIFFQNLQNGFLYNVVNDENENNNNNKNDNNINNSHRMMILKKYAPFFNVEQYHITHSFSTRLLDNNHHRFAIPLNWQQVNTPRARNIFIFCIKLHRFAFPGYVVDFLSKFPRLFPSETSVDKIEVAMMQIMRERHPLWCEFAPELRFQTFCAMDAIDCLRPLLNYNVESTVFIFCILSIWIRDKLAQCATLWPELVDPLTGLPTDSLFGDKLDEITGCDPDTNHISATTAANDDGDDDDHGGISQSRLREDHLDHAAHLDSIFPPLELLRHFKIDSTSEWYSRNREIDFGPIFDRRIRLMQSVIPQGVEYYFDILSPECPIPSPEFYHREHQKLADQIENITHDNNNNQDAATSDNHPESDFDFTIVTANDSKVYNIPVPRHHQTSAPYYFNSLLLSSSSSSSSGKHHSTQARDDDDDDDLYPRGFPSTSEPSSVYPIVTSKRKQVQRQQPHIFTLHKRGAEVLFNITPEQVDEHLNLICARIYNGKRANGVPDIQRVPYSLKDRFNNNNNNNLKNIIIINGKILRPSVSVLRDEDRSILSVSAARNRRDGFEDASVMAKEIERRKIESTSRSASGAPSLFCSPSPSISMDRNNNNNNSRSPSIAVFGHHHDQNNDNQNFESHSFYRNDEDDRDFDLFGVNDSTYPRFEELIALRYSIRTNTNLQLNSWSPFAKFYYDFLDVDPLFAWGSAYASRRSFVNTHRERGSVLLRVVLHEFMANLPRDLHERFYRILKATPGTFADVKEYRDLVNYVPIPSSSSSSAEILGFANNNSNNNSNPSQKQQQQQLPKKMVPLTWPTFDIRPIDWKGHSLRVFAHVMQQNYSNSRGINPSDQIDENFLESYFQGLSYGKLFEGFHEFTENQTTAHGNSEMKKKNDNNNNSNNNNHEKKNNLPPSRLDVITMVDGHNGPEKYIHNEIDERCCEFDHPCDEIVDKYRENPDHGDEALRARYVNRFRNSGMGNYIPSQNELSNKQFEEKQKQHQQRENSNDDDQKTTSFPISAEDYLPRPQNGKQYFFHDEDTQDKLYRHRGLKLEDNPHYSHNPLAIRRKFTKSIFSDEVRGLTSVHQKQRLDSLSLSSSSPQQFNNHNNSNNTQTFSKVQQD